MIEEDSCILVPFDATELSLKALEYAKEVAIKSDSSLTLLYVVDDSCLCTVGIRDSTSPPEFRAVGQFYREFSQIDYDIVTQIMQKSDKEARNKRLRLKDNSDATNNNTTTKIKSLETILTILLADDSLTRQD